MSNTFSNRKSICIVSASPLTIHFFLKPHISELSKKYNITVIYDPENDSYIGELNLNARMLPIRMARKLNIFKDLLSLYDFRKIFKDNKFDLVLSVAPKAGLLSNISAVIGSSAKRVHIFQGEYWASKTGLLRLILKKADFLTAFLADEVLAVSNSEKNFLISEGVVPRDKITVLASGSIGGVNVEKYQFSESSRVEIRHQLGIPLDATVLLFMGRMAADKGVFELAQAYLQCYASCPNLYLLMVGPDEDGVQEKIFSNDVTAMDRVRVVGFTDSPKQYFSAADIFCLPSYREGFPISILEASAAGIPSIGTNIYGISDAIIDGSTGILVEPRNPSALADAITYLYQDSDESVRLGKNAYDRALQLFEEDLVVRDYVEYLSRSIENKPLNIFFLAIKRAIDIVFSVVASCFLFIPILLVALAIKLTSKGPVIYWSDRVGKNNTIFRMAKFRSMGVETPALASDLLLNPDQFITPIGKFMRRSSLDELPQLWNIFKGEMTLVGPRPALFNQDRLIDLRTKMGISSLRPGLTGWAQVNGRDGISDDEKIKLDAEYMQAASPSLDIQILAMTFLKVFRGEGVSH